MGHPTRRELLQGVGVVAGGGLLGASLAGVPVRQAAAQGAASPRRGGKVTWGTESDPVHLIPFGSDATATYRAILFVYEGLLRWDKDFRIQPALAESYTIPNDRTYVFKLRRGVKFHSGKEMDAEDVKYSIELQRTPPPPGVDAGFYPKIANVEVVDRYTARLNMSAPDASALGYLAWSRFSSIIPKGAYDQGDLRRTAVGTGPFKLAEFVPNDHVRYVRNPDYWRAPLPHLDEITMKILPDERSRLSALRSGQIDGATLSIDSARVLANDSSIQVLKGLTAAFRELEIKIAADPKRPWNDVRVRQAVNFAINRQEIIEKVYGGDGVYSGKISPGYGEWPIAESELKSTYEKYDVARAKQLLAEAGHANGFPVTMFSIANPRDYTRIAEVLKEQLKQINIDVTVQPQEIGTFSKNNTDGTFEFAVTGRGMRPDPAGFMADFDPSGGTYKAWYQGGWKNDEMTRLVTQGKETTDPAKRREQYRRMEQIVLTEWPLIPLVSAMKYQAVRRRLHDMYVGYTDVEPGLMEAWVDS